MREGFAREAEDLAEQLVERGSFDAVRDLAEVYPLKVFPDALGLSATGRDNLLTYGQMVFNGFGPRNALFESSLANAKPVLEWIGLQCRRVPRLPQRQRRISLVAACVRSEPR